MIGRTLATLLVLAVPLAARAADEPGRLHVLGHASLEVAPDFAAAQVGVASKAATAAAALAENSAAACKVIDLAKASGIEEKDIATSAVSLSQAFKEAPPPGARVPDGYAANNAVTIRVRDIGRLGDLLRRVVESGANRLAGVSFGLNDPGKALEDAQAAAVTDAVRRAGRIATAAGVSLGPIEDIAAPPSPDRRDATMAGSADLPMRRLAGPAVTVPIEGGTVTVTAEVDVTFRLVQP